ncbi:MAG: AAA family ATPase, partial [Paracoccus sp. (in: a-proteobacteria)]|uniref:AAA family ATPase n=3 Tax=Paracoccus sp. TaxID=267 RepID=UPI004058811E
QRNTSLESRVMVPAFLHLLISSLLKTSKSQIGASVTVPFSGSSSGKRAGTDMPTISFAHPKGGARKTTSALLAATQLAEARATVTIIDADPERWISQWRALPGKPKAIRIISDVTEEMIVDVIEREAAQAKFVIVDLEGTAVRGPGHGCAYGGERNRHVRFRHHPATRLKHGCEGRGQSTETDCLSSQDGTAQHPACRRPDPHQCGDLIAEPEKRCK